MCLTAGFKSFVSVGDENIPIKTDFKVWLSVDKILKSDMSPEKKITSVLGLVYTKLPGRIEDAVSAAMNFYSGRKKKGGGKSCARYFDFDYDGELILAAFMQQYRINLLKENLHWHEFLALFGGLTAETLFMRTVKIRSMDISKINDKDKRRELNSLKRACALPRTNAEEKENEELISRLKNRG